MIFEGPEKKLEINFDSTRVDLLKMDRPFWDEVIAAAQAQIISEQSTETCRAYLLSESSLFVYCDRIILITCGTTRLVGAAEKLVEKLGRPAIVGLFYQRKNENFPHYQKTNFFEDASILARHFDGRSFQFGEQDDHHMFLFHWSASSVETGKKSDDFTLEVLMNGLPRDSRENFFSKKMTTEFIDQSGMRTILPGFQVDDFVFDPLGYSINALKGSKYFTIHVTPQSRGSYVSFETNAVNESDCSSCISTVVELFKPSTFDVITFDPSDDTSRSHMTGSCDREFGNYQLRRQVAHKLDSGYMVSFCHYFEPIKDVEAAYEITGSMS